MFPENVGLDDRVPIRRTTFPFRVSVSVSVSVLDHLLRRWRKHELDVVSVDTHPPVQLREGVGHDARVQRGVQP